jgi:DNA mismatch endonuclease (patch repair protein)
MSRIRGIDTAPEVLLRKNLWAAGLRYRLGRKTSLPGKPDLIFAGARVAVFVDGCFWHCCPLHGHTPKSSVPYWQGKLERNMTRDRNTNSKLADLGWLPIRIWEHEVTENISACVDRVADAVRLRSNHGYN